MKKQFLLSAALLLCGLTAFAATPYTNYPYKYDVGGTTWTTGAAYSVPDAAIPVRDSLKVSSVAPNANSYNKGCRADYFDQATTTVSAYATDYNKTCGRTYSGTELPATTVSTVRGWTTSPSTDTTTTYNNNLTPFLGYNGNPGTFRQGGGYYMYTVNFTQTGSYEFCLRLRYTDSTQVNNKKIEIFKKSDMSTVIATRLINTKGLFYADNTGISNSSTINNAQSYDKSVTCLFKAKTAAIGATVSMWIAINEKINIASAEEYVVKITDVSSTIINNSGIGGFTLIRSGDVTSVDGTSKDDVKVSVYPNPCTDVLNVATDLAVSAYEITNIAGQKVLAGSLVGTTINVSALAQGTYNLKVTTSAGVKSVQFIK